MADLRIQELTFDPGGQNLARGDLMLITRAGVDYKATIGGPLLLPTWTSADAGKSLIIDPTSNIPAFTGAAVSEYRQVFAASNLQNLSSVDVGNAVAAYQDYFVTVRTGSGTTDTKGMAVPKGTFVIPSPAGDWQVWWTLNFTRLNFQVNSGNSIQRLWIYAR